MHIILYYEEKERKKHGDSNFQEKGNRVKHTVWDLTSHLPLPVMQSILLSQKFNLKHTTSLFIQSLNFHPLILLFSSIFLFMFSLHY
jgi:hypothetical protein